MKKLILIASLLFVQIFIYSQKPRARDIATHKLVEKNKQVRLAVAKKTIEELEKNN
jgi:hypothetical protein